MKIKCKKCGDIIEGDKKGTFIQCKCKSCFIDETEYYYRVGGNPGEIEEIKEEMNKEEIENILNQLEKVIKEPVSFDTDPITDEVYEYPNHFVLDPTTNDCKILYDYIISLQNNWNGLKNWLETNKYSMTCQMFVAEELLEKMQELEQEKDENN